MGRGLAPQQDHFLTYLGWPSALEFAALVEKLCNSNIATGGRVNASFLQDIPIQRYLSKDYHFGLGFSATPSLHNAIAVLYVFAEFRMGVLIGWMMILYAIVIFIGSLHLAWQYAVDGIVTTFGMCVIWHLVNWWCVASGYYANVDAETNAKVVTA